MTPAEKSISLIGGVGTGGTITARGISQEQEKDIKIVAVDPSDSPVLSGGSPGPTRYRDRRGLCT